MNIYNAFLTSAQLQDMEINESDKDDNEDENESESEEPDKQMGDVEEDNQTNEVFFYLSPSIFKLLKNA